MLNVLRTEKKYSISNEISLKLRSSLLAGMQSDAHNGPSGYRVRSLYFDTLYDHDFNDKESGFEYRKKIRLRIYDPSANELKLEMKEKKGQLQQKRSLIITRAQAEQIILGNYTCLLEMNTEFSKELYITMQTGLYRPKTIVEYKRQAFILKENVTRITIDTEIKATEACTDIFSETLNMYPVSFDTILEVKYNRFLFDYIKDLIYMVNKKEVAVSKYAMARSISRF